VHGAHVLAPRAPGLAGTGDALVARSPDVVLAVGAADCLPVLAWDRKGHAVAAVHAGWRGIVAGVVTQAVAALEQAGVPASRLGVALGARIGPCCFVVGPDVASRFAPRFVRTEGERRTVDLAAAARAQLDAVGVDPSRVRDLGACTACDPDAWFSHRRDVGRTGRAWGIVALVPAGPRKPSETAV